MDNSWEFWALIIGPLTAIVAVLLQNWWNEKSNYKKAKLGLIDEIDRNISFINSTREEVKKRLSTLEEDYKNKRSPNIVRPLLLDIAYNHFIMSGYFTGIPANLTEKIHNLYNLQSAISDYINRHRSIELTVYPADETIFKNIRANLTFLNKLMEEHDKEAVELKNIIKEKGSVTVMVGTADNSEADKDPIECDITVFIKQYFQVFVVIGVFGALSLYLSNFADKYSTTQNNIFILLKSGSLLCLVILILLSIEICFKIQPYLKACYEKENLEKKSYRYYFWDTWESFQLNLFRDLFILIVALISGYLLFFSELASIFLNSLISIIILFIILWGLYRPALIYLKSDKEKKNGIWIIRFLFGFLALFSVYYIYTNWTNLLIVIICIALFTISIHTIYKSIRPF